MSEYKESTDPTPTEVELLTQNVAILTQAIQTQNDVLLVLVNKLNLDTDLPDWKTREEITKAAGPKIEACVDLIRKAYGPSEADKS